MMVDSKFLCSEYDDRMDQVANETDSTKRDHSCNVGNVTADGKFLGEVDTFGVDGDPRTTHHRVL